MKQFIVACSNLLYLRCSSLIYYYINLLGGCRNWSRRSGPRNLDQIWTKSGPNLDPIWTGFLKITAEIPGRKIRLRTRESLLKIVANNKVCEIHTMGGQLHSSTTNKMSRATPSYPKLSLHGQSSGATKSWRRRYPTPYAGRERSGLRSLSLVCSLGGAKCEMRGIEKQREGGSLGLRWPPFYKLHATIK